MLAPCNGPCAVRTRVPTNILELGQGVARAERNANTASPHHSELSHHVLFPGGAEVGDPGTVQAVGRRLLTVCVRVHTDEILGMCLSNPLDPANRIPGHVGLPLPGVRVKISHSSKPEESGTLLVKGPTVFKEYWGLPEKTAKEFDEMGWFKTGDCVELSEFPDDQRSYRIIGRQSVDIIKSGGYKISALDVEASLLDHPLIDEVAVVGIPCDEYGQRVCAIVGGSSSSLLDLETLRAWCKQRMAHYKAPTSLKLMDAIPRNQMGKVNKKALVAELDTY